MGYSPKLGKLYIKYDEYTGVKGESDITSGKKKGEYTVSEDNSKFSVLLQRLGDRGNIAVQGLTSGGAPAAKGPSEDEIKFYMKKNPNATRAQIIEGLKNK